MTSAKSGA
uniref:Uncharacterized protein n=1 Tax=Anguilla anguilla TaxID=7936 RepID=A0A0E9XL29_ANGAN